ncbi:uncharacterized protein LOC108670406 [Hyalella azteca]|uniref:Uncharacterized protein LOC108670406 n=1 Tax=Hyalella azteca TaxID=294128 RepID=A0A8B7NIA2_HYAAZ|nr:uncharacterized protein LOC108670406 [Hyalella azteca]
MYVDVDPNGGNPTINIDTGITSSQRNWNIKVDQIACNSPYKAPEGCTQYYTNSSGIVESFNYVQPTAAQIADASASLHLNNLRYGICVASRSGYCSISWTKGDTVTTNPYTFGISGDAQGLSPTLIGTETASLTGTANCSADYVLIPSGEYVDTAGVSVMADRFCGLGFPEQVVVSDIQPFVMYVVTDSNETGDAANFGFRLQYRQNACT